MRSRTVRKVSDNSVISTENFTYDMAGNITDAPYSCFAYDMNNRLVTFNGQSVSYDADGNMTCGNNTCCEYDSLNRLISAGAHDYIYNAENVRIRNLCEDEDTSYVYNTNCKLSQLLMKTTNNAVTKYVYGLGLIGEEVSGAFKTYHFDCRGSTIAITDASGNITDTFAYDTYGKRTVISGTSDAIFGYNGRDGVVTDDNGLIYMRARYYSPEMRRFVNADIIAGKINNAVTLNRYAYANANPAMFVDPLGLEGEFAKWWKKNISDPFKEKVVEPFVEHVVEPVATFVEEKIIEPIVNGANRVIAVNQNQQEVNNRVRNQQIDIVDKAVEKITDSALDWIIANAPEPVANFASDIKNYDKDNSSEQTVLESHYFSSYKGKFVLNLPIGDNAFSFGIIFMGTGVPDTEYNDVKHEYGHTVQFDNMGVAGYIKNVGIPSITAYILDKNDNLPYDYYTAPWEAEADFHGWVNPKERNRSDPWTAEDGYYNFSDLINVLFS